MNSSSNASRAAMGPVAHVATEAELSAADYEAVLADHRRLVRELDVLLNGEAGAAPQASLCDIVAQVRQAVSGLRCDGCGGHFQTLNEARLCGLCAEDDRQAKEDASERDSDDHL